MDAIVEGILGIALIIAGISIGVSGLAKSEEDTPNSRKMSLAFGSAFMMFGLYNAAMAGLIHCGENAPYCFLAAMVLSGLIFVFLIMKDMEWKRQQQNASQMGNP